MASGVGYNRRYPTPGRPPTSSVAPVALVPPVVSVAAVQSEQERLRVEAAARGGSVQLRSGEQAVDITTTLSNPTVRANLVEFVVPSGQTLEVTRIAVQYSNPFIAMAQAVGWRITINGAPLPHIRPATGGLFYLSVGDISQGMSIDPVFVQNGSTVAIEIVPVAGFNEALSMVGRISAHLTSNAGRI